MSGKAELVPRRAVVNRSSALLLGVIAATLARPAPAQTTTDPAHPAAEEAARPEWAGEPADPGGAGWASERRFRLRTSYGDDSSDFQRVAVDLMVEFRARPETRIRIEPLFTRFEENGRDLGRFTIGGEIRQGLARDYHGTLRYRLHKTQTVAVTHEVAGELAGRPFANSLELKIGAIRRALVDTPRGYEDVAYLEGVGSGGSTLEAIKERLQVAEGYIGATLAPLPGGYVYAQGTFGEINDGNERASAVAGFGIDLLRLAHVLPAHSVTLRYGYFFLSMEREVREYFSPQNFQVHSPGLEWRWHSSEGWVLGVEGGASLRRGARAGWIAGAFARVRVYRGVDLEARFLATDDTVFRSTQATLGLVADF